MSGRCRSPRASSRCFEYLAGRAGEVVPKRDILANVWEDDFDGPENVVEVHVHALRRKLERRRHRDHPRRRLPGAG